MHDIIWYQFLPKFKYQRWFPGGSSLSRRRPSLSSLCVLIFSPTGIVSSRRDPDCNHFCKMPPWGWQRDQKDHHLDSDSFWFWLTFSIKNIRRKEHICKYCPQSVVRFMAIQSKKAVQLTNPLSAIAMASSDIMWYLEIWSNPFQPFYDNC